MVADGETGLVVEPGDPEALPASIEILLESPPSHRKWVLRGASRLNACSRFRRMWQRSVAGSGKLRVSIAPCSGGCVMRVAYLSADCGIPVFGSKGASVHIQEMVRAMRQQGADVRVVATRIRNPSDDDVGAIHVFHSACTQCQGWWLLSARGGQHRRLQAWCGQALVSLHAKWPFDMIYERYSLWSDACVSAAQTLGGPVPSLKSTRLRSWIKITPPGLHCITALSKFSVMSSLRPMASFAYFRSARLRNLKRCKILGGANCHGQCRRHGTVQRL